MSSFQISRFCEGPDCFLVFVSYCCPSLGDCHRCSLWSDGSSWSREESYWALSQPRGTVPLEACCGDLPALWICLPGKSWLYCFEAVKLLESDLSRAVFHLLAVTPGLLWRSYTIYSSTSVICHWSWLVKKLSEKSVFLKCQHVKPGKYQKYDTVYKTCQNLRGDCAVR